MFIDRVKDNRILKGDVWHDSVLNRQRILSIREQESEGLAKRIQALDDLIKYQNEIDKLDIDPNLKKLAKQQLRLNTEDILRTAAMKNIQVAKTAENFYNRKDAVQNLKYNELFERQVRKSIFARQ